LTHEQAAAVVGGAAHVLGMAAQCGAGFVQGGGVQPLFPVDAQNGMNCQPSAHAPASFSGAQTMGPPPQ
jgi:hypothetical protein